MDALGATKLKEVLNVNKTLTSLTLWKCDICSKGAEELAEALKASQTLTKLELQKNSIDSAGAIFSTELQLER